MLLLRAFDSITTPQFSFLFFSFTKKTLLSILTYHSPTSTMSPELISGIVFGTVMALLGIAGYFLDVRKRYGHWKSVGTQGIAIRLLAISLR